MILHKVQVYPSKINLPKKKQLAWKIAEISSDNAKLNKNSIEMVINRIIDNASVAIASLNRKSVISSREMALKHPRKNGATLFGINSKLRFDCEWAAWSNGTAVRELDFHDTFLAADYSHPADNIPPILAVAQQMKTLDYAPAFQFSHPKAFELAERITQFMPAGLNRVFYTNSGSEAAETSLKIARAYWRKKGMPSKTKLIGRAKGYHGVNWGGISVGGIGPNRALFGEAVAADHLPHTVLPENKFVKGM